MKKNYQYNAQGLKNAMDKYRIKKVDIQRLFGYANNVQINRWMDGCGIYLDKACEICNHFELDFAETFLNEMQPESPKESAKSEIRTANERPTSEDIAKSRSTRKPNLRL